MGATGAVGPGASYTTGKFKTGRVACIGRFEQQAVRVGSPFAPRVGTTIDYATPWLYSAARGTARGWSGLFTTEDTEITEIVRKYCIDNAFEIMAFKADCLLALINSKAFSL